MACRRQRSPLTRSVFPDPVQLAGCDCGAILSSTGVLTTVSAALSPFVCRPGTTDDPTLSLSHRTVSGGGGGGGGGGTSLSLSTILACVTLETGPGSKTHRSSPTTLTHGLTANNCSVYQCFQLANTVCSRGEAGARRGGGGLKSTRWSQELSGRRGGG